MLLGISQNQNLKTPISQWVSYQNVTSLWSQNNLPMGCSSLGNKVSRTIVSAPCSRVFMVAGSMPRASMKGYVMSVRVTLGLATFTKTTKCCCCCVMGDCIWLSQCHANIRVYAFKNTLETRYVVELMRSVESLNHPSLCIRLAFKSSKHFLARKLIASLVRSCTSAIFSLNSALPRSCVVTIIVC